MKLGPSTYDWEHRRKPHLHPVTTPSGVVVTEVEPADHPWQRGLWFVVKLVGGDNFWEEFGPGWGVQRHVDPPSPSEEGAALDGELEWIRPDRSTVAVRERRQLRFVPLESSSYAIDWSVELAPGDSDEVVLDRTPYNGAWGGYSGLAFRGRSDWSDGRLLLDDGSAHKRVTPQRSRWCDLSGVVDGKEVGVCVLDRPSNPSHPVPFYATCQETKTIFPSFLWDGPMTLSKDEPLRFHYRVVVHDGIWDAAQCAAACTAFNPPARGSGGRRTGEPF